MMVGAQFELMSGMAILAEVKTGMHRLIEFSLSPLLKYEKTSMIDI